MTMRRRIALAAGCALDLHPRMFRAGCCAQTLLAKVPVILDQLDGSPTFHVLVRASFAAYLADWLVDAEKVGRWWVAEQKRIWDYRKGE